MDIDSVIASSACPILVADDGWRIVALNSAAEEQLGLAAAEARGKTCHEVICGMDEHGNLSCHGSCGLSKMATGDEPGPLKVVLRPHTAKEVSARVFILVVPGAQLGERRILHMLLPLHDPRAFRPVNGRGWARPLATSQSRLRESELKVLRLLAAGTSCQEIADSCYISLFTVRNHVQSILRKLGVHSQIEAVAAAHREHLL